MGTERKVTRELTTSIGLTVACSKWTRSKLSQVNSRSRICLFLFSFDTCQGFFCFFDMAAVILKARQTSR